MDVLHFADRQQAGLLLAEAVKPVITTNTIILALPRGGVEVGAVMATKLRLPLSIIIARKIGHPGNPEFAIGAITVTGQPVLNHEETDHLDPAWVEMAIERERREALRRQREYLGQRTVPKLKGLTVVLVDDGIATGLTLEAAVNEIHESKPKKIIVAAPIGPKDTVDHLSTLADRVITLNHGRGFRGSIGAHYDSFPQLTDDDVRRWLTTR